MELMYVSDEKKHTLQVNLLLARPCKVCLEVYDADQDNTYLTKREIEVKANKQSLYVRMPVTPKRLVVRAYAVGERPDSEATVKIAGMYMLPLKQNIKFIGGENQAIRSFIDFVTRFCYNAGVLDTGFYKSDNGKFIIQYSEEIRDKDNQGRERILKTPARTRKSDGMMQVCKKDFVKLPVPRRIAILLHEFSHFYLNDDMDNEVEADLNGMTIYVGLGWPTYEGYEAFAEVFKNTPTEQNLNRWQILEKAILSMEQKNGSYIPNPNAPQPNLSGYDHQGYGVGFQEKFGAMHSQRMKQPAGNNGGTQHGVPPNFQPSRRSAGLGGINRQLFKR